MSARKEWMNDDQWECWQLIGQLWGFNHVYNKPKPLTVKKYSGIEINLPVHNMATFDYDDLTRFVFLCHDMQIRGSIHGSGPNLVKINLWKRQNRDGTFSERHPTLETAVEKWRKEEAKKEALKRRMDNLTPEQREIVEKTMEGIYTRLKADIDADATYSGD